MKVYKQIKVHMITFVCCPKPFNDDFNVVQNNAIQSWKQLKNVRNIVIVGTDIGCKEYSEINGLIYEPDVRKNEWGTPLVDSIFELGRNHTPENELLCYINSDIILLSTFSKTIQAWSKIYAETIKDVLFVGLRWDWNSPSAIDFSDPNWETNVQILAKSNGKMHECSGMDYFVHTLTTYPMIYPFAIGRYFWDWWLVGNCYRRGLMCIDISKTAFVIHQNCPWFQNNKTVTSRRQMYQTKEVQRNHSFDTFGRHIDNGTNWISYYDETNTIQFKKK